MKGERDEFNNGGKELQISLCLIKGYVKCKYVACTVKAHSQ